MMAKIKVYKNTDVKISLQNLIEKYKPVNIRPGGFYYIPNVSKYSAIIVYYSLIKNNYINTFVIANETYGTWYYDHHSQGAIYVRVDAETNRLEVSSIALGEAKVLGFISVY